MSTSRVVGGLRRSSPTNCLTPLGLRDGASVLTQMKVDTERPSSGARGKIYNCRTITAVLFFSLSFRVYRFLLHRQQPRTPQTPPRCLAIFKISPPLRKQTPLVTTIICIQCFRPNIPTDHPSPKPSSSINSTETMSRKACSTVEMGTAYFFLWLSSVQSLSLSASCFPSLVISVPSARL